MDRYRRYVAGDCVGGGIDLGDLRGARFERVDCDGCGTPACNCMRARNPGRVAVGIGPGGCFPPPPPPYAGEPRVPYCPPCPRAVPRAMPPRAVPAPRRDDPMEAVHAVAKEILPAIMPLLTQQAVGRARERDERRAVRSTAVGLTATIRSIVVMMEELIPRLPSGEVDRASTVPTSTVYAIYAALDNALSVIANEFSGGGFGSPPDDGGDDGGGDKPPRPFDDVDIDDVDIQASSPMPAEGSRDPSLDAILRKRAVIDAEPDRDMRTIAARSAVNPSMYHDALRRRVKDLYAKGHISDQVFADIAGHMSNSPFGCCVKVKVDDAPVVYTAPVIEAQTINDLIGWIDRKGARGKVAVATLCVLDSGGLTMAVTSFKMPLRKTETATRSTMLSVDPDKGALVDAEADLRDPYARQTEAVVKEWNAMTPEERLADQKRLAEAGIASPIDEAQLRRLAAPAMESTR